MPTDGPGTSPRRVVRVGSHSLNVSAKTNGFFVAVQDESGQTGGGEASLNGWEPMLLAAVVPECAMLQIQFGESPLSLEIAPGSHPAVTQGVLRIPATSSRGPGVDNVALLAHPYRPVPAGIESHLFA